MQAIIARLRAGKKNDEGFTLIELLVVVVIIGVLVAIAVPVYLNYRQGAADKAAQSDVRGAISAVEQYYTSNGNEYPGDADLIPATTAYPGQIGLRKKADGKDGSITISDGTELHYVFTTNTDSYKICATNKDGSDNKWYLYDSSAGGSVTDKNTAFPTTGCGA